MSRPNIVVLARHELAGGVCAAAIVCFDRPCMSAAASDADFPSGPWTGFFLVEGSKVPVDLELTFDGGVMRGGGWDLRGQFVVRGSYELDSREVRWTRRYDDGTRLTGRGFREGKGIWGTWRRRDGGTGGFHIWPLGASG